MNELNVNSHNKDDTPNTLISFEIPLDSVITIASLSLLLKQKTFITKISKSFPILELKISLHTHTHTNYFIGLLVYQKLFPSDFSQKVQ